MADSPKNGHMPFGPGWYGEAMGNGFVARRLDRLTDYQLLNGCLPEVQALDEGELWLLCDAQTRLAERIALAESIRRQP
ncbi:hypothetical protein F8568_009720 [Actinomadura sp. LD22]|uniref:Uncharacterized protein n=1 Tax=Actinomadura physcomitrii TaxID=2650748 RepID=A0A6I4M6N7_9ACTN|nr:hypothetical protein [Actinomadura physcomitrii]MWA00650.1 hypothetical protein [Actinomadura physcomitrii]